MENLKKELLLTTLLTSLILLNISTAFSASATGGLLTVNPIVGYERVQKLMPTPHTRDRLVYGFRVMFGIPLLSLELEATKADDKEVFVAEDMTVLEESYAGKLGIRSSISMASIFSWYLRAGGHARKKTETITKAGVETVNEPALRVSPYAGAGFRFTIGPNLAVNGGVTAIFTGKPKGSDREYQTTLGFSAGI